MTKEQQNALISICTGAAILIVALIKFIPLFNGNDKENSNTDISNQSSYSADVESDTTSTIYLEFPTTPFDVSSLNYSNKISTTYRITNITYESNYNLAIKGYSTKIYVSGTKTFDIKGNDNSDYETISWKIYDIENSSIVADSGNLFPPDLCVGECFEKEMITTYDLEKRRKYKLVFYDE